MRKRKYVKISVDMFDNSKLKLIENMEKRDMIEVIWMKLLLEATKTNDEGMIYLEKDIPYNNSMLSIILGRSEEDIELALKVLKELKMIEVDENNFIYVFSWSNYNESERKRNEDKKESSTNVQQEHVKSDRLEEKSKNFIFEEVNKDNKNKNKAKGVQKRKKKKAVNTEEIVFKDEVLEDDVGYCTFTYGTEEPKGTVVSTFTF